MNTIAYNRIHFVTWRDQLFEGWIRLDGQSWVREGTPQTPGAIHKVPKSKVTGLSSLDPDDAPSCYEYAHRMTMTSTRHALEALMSRTRTTPWPVSSPSAREHFGKGEAKGRAEGLAEALLTVLRAAGIEVSAQADHRIKSCTDLAQLESWLARAVTVRSTDELFA